MVNIWPSLAVKKEGRYLRLKKLRSLKRVVTKKDFSKVSKTEVKLEISYFTPALFFYFNREFYIE